MKTRIAKKSKKKISASRFIRQYSAKLRADIDLKVRRANATVPAARRVSLSSAIEVANRNLAITASYNPHVRVFSALRAVDSFISLALHGKQTTGTTKYADLLAIGHPLSTRSHSMNSASLRAEKARWLASDPSVSDEYRPLVAAAFSAFPGSAEREHAFIRLSIAPSGSVPAHLRIDNAPLTAAFGLGLGGNSSAARSLRAKLQRRDRKGRFAEMGGGWSFNLRMPDGIFRKVSGRVAGLPAGDNDGVEVEIKGSRYLPDGVYTTKASKGEAAKAILPEKARAGLPQVEKAVGTDDVFVDFKDIRPTRGDAPSGWTRKVLATHDGDALRPSRIEWTNQETAYSAVETLNRDRERQSLELRRGLDDSTVKGAEKLDDWGDVQKALDADQPEYIKVLQKAEAERTAGASGLPDNLDVDVSKMTLEELEKSLRDSFKRLPSSIEASKKQDSIAPLLQKAITGPDETVIDGVRVPKGKKRLAPWQKEVIGPRRPGGRYKARYGDWEYEVVDISIDDQERVSITVKDDDGNIWSHSTGWDERGDKIIKDPPPLRLSEEQQRQIVEDNIKATDKKLEELGEEFAKRIDSKQTKSFPPKPEKPKFDFVGEPPSPEPTPEQVKKEAAEKIKFDVIREGVRRPLTMEEARQIEWPTVKPLVFSPEERDRYGDYLWDMNGLLDEAPLGKYDGEWARDTSEILKETDESISEDDVTGLIKLYERDRDTEARLEPELRSDYEVDRLSKEVDNLTRKLDEAKRADKTPSAPTMSKQDVTRLIRAFNMKDLDKYDPPETRPEIVKLSDRDNETSAVFNPTVIQVFFEQGTLEDNEELIKILDKLSERGAELINFSRRSDYSKSHNEVMAKIFGSDDIPDVLTFSIDDQTPEITEENVDFVKSLHPNYVSAYHKWEESPQEPYRNPLEAGNRRHLYSLSEMSIKNNLDNIYNEDGTLSQRAKDLLAIKEMSQEEAKLAKEGRQQAATDRVAGLNSIDDPKDYYSFSYNFGPFNIAEDDHIFSEDTWNTFANAAKELNKIGATLKRKSRVPGNNGLDIRIAKPEDVNDAYEIVMNTMAQGGGLGDFETLEEYYKTKVLDEVAAQVLEREASDIDEKLQRLAEEAPSAGTEPLTPGNADEGSTYERSTWTMPDGSRLALYRKYNKGEYVLEKIRPAREGDDPSKVSPDGTVLEDMQYLDSDDLDVEEKAFAWLNERAGAAAPPSDRHELRRRGDSSVYDYGSGIIVDRTVYGGDEYVVQTKDNRPLSSVDYPTGKLKTIDDAKRAIENYEDNRDSIRNSQLADEIGSAIKERALSIAAGSPAEKQWKSDLKKIVERFSAPIDSQRYRQKINELKDRVDSGEIQWEDALIEAETLAQELTGKGVVPSRTAQEWNEWAKRRHFPGDTENNAKIDAAAARKAPPSTGARDYIINFDALDDDTAMEEAGLDPADMEDLSDAERLQKFLEAWGVADDVEVKHFSSVLNGRGNSAIISIPDDVRDRFAQKYGYEDMDSLVEDSPKSVAEAYFDTPPPPDVAPGGPTPPEGGPEGPAPLGDAEPGLGFDETEALVEGIYERDLLGLENSTAKRDELMKRLADVMSDEDRGIGFDDFEQALDEMYENDKISLQERNNAMAYVSESMGDDDEGGPTPPEGGPEGPRPPRDITGGTPEDRIAQITDAIDNGDDISFIYNGKERTITPEGTWQNAKTGATNVYGMDKDLGEKRTYTVEKMEAKPEPVARPEGPVEATPLRGDDVFGLRTAVEDAIQGKSAVSFMYNDKERVFIPERIYTNSKSGTTNVVGYSVTDGEERTFILEKMQVGEIDQADIDEMDQMLLAEFDAMFETPEGAYKPDIYGMYQPKGRTNEKSDDYTDDPEVLSAKFSQTELAKALADSVLPGSDGQPATGKGQLSFDGGDESVPAEALFDALQRSGVDGDMILAGIYDRALDADNPDRPERNTDRVQQFRQDMLIGPEEGPRTQVPVSQLEQDMLRDDIAPRSERLTRTARVGALLADYDERNETLKKVASTLRSNNEITLEEFFSDVKNYAFSSKPEEQEAFAAAWGVLMSIDGGDTPDDLEEAGPSSWRAQLVEILERDAGSRQVAEDEYYDILSRFGGYREFMDSRARVMSGEDSLDSRTTGAAFYRLIDAAGAPNAETLYRVITVDYDDDILKTYLVEGSTFYADSRSWTLTDISDGSLASKLFMSGRRDGVRVVFEALPGEIDKSVDISGLSWFDGESESLAGGKFEVVSVRDNAGKFGGDEYVVQVRAVRDGAQTQTQTQTQTEVGVRDVGSIDDWEMYSEGTGSNPGGFYRDADGNEYYVKTPHSRSHAENEALASLFYRILGVDAAEVALGEKDGDLRIVSPLVPGARPDDVFTRINANRREIRDQEYVEKLQRGFVIDAWLGNYDAIGYLWDGSTNVVTDRNGNPVRVDPGGALMWRARGSAKGEMFGDEATELDTMRDPRQGEQASIFFGDLTDEQLREYAKPLRDLIPSEIDEIIDRVITDPNDADLIKRKLKSRRQYILDRLGVREGADDPEMFPNPEPLTDAMGYSAQDLLPGDVTAQDSFVIEKIFRDEETPKGKVSVQGYFPGHESQRKEWNEATVIDVSRGGTIPPKGDKPALHKPKPPRKPSPGAFTGSVKEMLAGVDNWAEAADVIRGLDMVFFDYETTGFASDDEPDALNRPIQLGAVRVRDGKVVDRFNVYMNPETPMTKWSRENLKARSSDIEYMYEDYTKLPPTYKIQVGWEIETIDRKSGKVVSVETIDPDSAEPVLYSLVTDEWLSQQMPMKDAHQRFVEWAGESPILGGQYVPFDLEVLQRTLREQGLEMNIAGTIDSKDIAAGSLPKWSAKNPVGPMQVGTDGKRRASNSLGPVAEFLGVDLPDWHRADADAEASWNVIDAMLTRAVGNPDTPTTILDVDGSFEKDAAQSAFYQAELEQYKADLAEYEAAKAIAAAWNCGGSGITAAVGNNEGPCDVPSVDDLIKRVNAPIIEPVDTGDIPSAQQSSIDRVDKDGVDVKDPYADEKFPPTEQQRAIVDAVLTGENTVARALAGTGKTSTLQLIARRLQKEQPNKRIIYVAFNKSIQLEAEAKMPGNVESRTADSIAYRASDPKIRAKMNNKNALVKIKDVAANFGITGVRNPDNPDEVLSSADVVKTIRDAVNNYTISADDEIGPQHFPFENVTPQMLEWAQRWWDDINDPDGVLRVTNSHLTKIWALSRPDLSKVDSGTKYPADVIFFDEAQDINPVLGKVIGDQNIQVVYVGDSNQAIYGFRGAVDQLDGIEAPNDLPLTKSWRFGPEVAGMGNRFLTLIGSKDKIEGAGPGGEILPAGTMTDADAVLVRTNAGAIKEIFDELGRGRVVGVTKNYKDDLKSFNESARWLASGASPSNRPRKVHDDIAPYSSWKELLEDIETGKNRKVAKLLDLIDDIGFDGIDEMLDRLVVYKSSEDGAAPSTGVGETGGLPPMSGTPGASGDLVDGVQYSIVGDEIRLSGKNMFPNKDAAKDKGFKWRPETKTWYKSYKTEPARLAALNDLREAMGGPSAADSRKIDVVITTAHRSKGLEWDSVRIGGDFWGPRISKDTGEVQMPAPEELKLDYVAVTRAKKRLDPGALSWVYDYTSDDDALTAPTAASDETSVELPSDIPPPSPGPSGMAETPDEYAPEEASPLVTVEDSSRDQDVNVVTESLPSSDLPANYMENIEKELNLIVEQADDSLENGDKFEKKIARELKNAIEIVERFKNGDLTADEAAEELIALEQGLREITGQMKADTELASNFADMIRDVRRIIDRSAESGAELGKDLPPENSGKGFDKNGVFIKPGTRVRDKWGYAGTVIRYNKSGGWNNVYILKDVDHRDPDQLSEKQKKKWGPRNYIDSKGTKTLTVIKDGDDNSPWIDVSKEQDGKRTPPKYEEQLAEYNRKKEGEDGGEGPVGVKPPDGPDSGGGDSGEEPEAGTTEALRENIEEKAREEEWSGEEADRPKAEAPSGAKPPKSPWAAPLQGTGLSSTLPVQDAISIVKNTGQVEAQSLVDGPDIERMQVSFSVINDVSAPDAEEQLRMKFTLSQKTYTKLKSLINKNVKTQELPWKRKENTNISFRKSSVGDDGTIVVDSPEYRVSDDAGNVSTYTDPDGRFVITVLEPTQPYYGYARLDQSLVPTSATALDRSVTVVFSDYPDDLAIADALEAAGVETIRPSTESDLRSMVEKELAITFSGRTEKTIETEPAAAEYSAQEVEERLGVSIAGNVTVETTPYGMVEAKMPVEAARAISRETGVKELAHSYYDVPLSIFDGDLKPWVSRFLDKLTDERFALLSTVKRFNNGVQFRGQSFDADMATGGANYVYLKPQKNWFSTTSFDADISTATDVEFSWEGDDAIEVLRRLDAWSNVNDLYGAKPEGTSYLDRLSPGSYELTIRDHLPLSRMSKVFVSKLVRNALLEEAHNRGVTEINGKPVNKFFVLPREVDDPLEWKPNVGAYGKEGETI